MIFIASARVLERAFAPCSATDAGVPRAPPRGRFVFFFARVRPSEARARDSTATMARRRAARARAVAVAIVVVVVAVVARVSGASGASRAIDSVRGRSADVRVFAPRDEVRAERGDADGDRAREDGDGAYEDGDGARGASDDAGARMRVSYDEYVAAEVARLERSLVESSAEPDYGAIEDTLNAIAYDVQSDLERIARARAMEMTYAGDLVPRAGEPYPPADFDVFASEAYIIYDADGSQVIFEPQSALGTLMQQLTWINTIFPGNPSAIDDYMRCATLVRPCSVEEVLRKCTYEPRGTWYRERLSRMNAPLTWPYCQPDLEEVYKFCTEFEAQASICDPRRARERMYLSRTIAINGGTAPCLRWRTNVFGVRECIDRGQR